MTHPSGEARAVTTDVAVIGAGPCGITMANLLAVYGVRAVVIDAQPGIYEYPRAVGIDDYVRAATTVGARHATAAEAADLELPAGSVVLVTRSLDVLADGTPLQVGITRFAAGSVELDVAHADAGWDEPA